VQEAINLSGDDANFAEPPDKFLKLLLAHIKLAAIGNKLDKLSMMLAQNSIEVTRA
jgi:hypothetical protein